MPAWKTGLKYSQGLQIFVYIPRADADKVSLLHWLEGGKERPAG